MSGVCCGRPAYFADDSLCLYLGNAVAVLSDMPDGCVDCVVTSPPYFGLHDHGVAGQLGLEPTVAQYVERVQSVFHELSRVLAADGTVWLNLADCYSGSGKERAGGGRPSRASGKQATDRGCRVGTLTKTCHEARPKSLLGIPWRVAYALMDDGWILRNEIIWHKRNAMPSSAKDRLTVKHESLFLLSKSDKYYFDLNAIKTPATKQSGSALTWGRTTKEADRPGQQYRQHRQQRTESSCTGVSNPGDVWDTQHTLPQRALRHLPPGTTHAMHQSGMQAGGNSTGPIQRIGHHRPGGASLGTSLRRHRHQRRIPGPEPTHQTRQPTNHQPDGRTSMSQPSDQVKRMVDRRDGWRCVRCGASLESVPGSRHHRRPRSHAWAGLHLASNLILLCGSGTTGCHGWVHANPAQAYEEGLLVHSWQYPHDQPIRTRGRGWVLLDNEGSWTPVQTPNDTEGNNHE